MKNFKLKSILLNAVLLSGCASLVPETYEMTNNPDIAILSLVSPQKYTIGADIYSQTENCLGRKLLSDSTKSVDKKRYLIPANKEVALSFYLNEKQIAGHSCHFTLVFTPKKDSKYLVSTKFNTQTKVCENQITETGNSETHTQMKVIDSLLTGASFSENSAWCKGYTPYTLESSSEFTTGLYFYSQSQALFYDYTPKRLEPVN